jgi:hypothetical protein
MENEKLTDFQTAAREAIIEYVFASSEEWQRLRDRLETIYEICRFQPAYKNSPAYRGIRSEMEYTLGINRSHPRTEMLARLRLRLAGLNLKANEATGGKERKTS